MFPQAPLWARVAHTVLHVRAFVSVSSAGTVSLLAILRALSIAADFVRTLLLTLSVSHHHEVTWIATWISHYASLTFCISSPSSPVFFCSFFFPLLLEDVSLSEDDEFLLDFLIFLSFFDFFHDRQSQSSCRRIAGPGCGPEDCELHP